MISYFLNGKKAVKGTFTDDKREIKNGLFTMKKLEKLIV